MVEKLAFDNVSGDWFTTNSIIFEAGYKASADSPRKRFLLPLHREQEAAVQRMVNFLQPGTYIRPHKHPLPEAIESIVMIKGRIKFFLFDDKGNIEHCAILAAGTAHCLIDLQPNVWHSFVALEPDTVLFEAKKGPYDVNTDKEFAAWAPEEYTHEASEWVKKMEAF